MTVYKYRAKKGPRDIIEDTLQAQSEKEAIEKISQLGYIPIRIDKQEETSSSQGVLKTKSAGRIISREITVFSRQLASLIKSGVTILSALNIIAEQSENPNLRTVLNNIHDEIREGTIFSAALAKYPGVFSSLYVAMIRAGEDSGTLPEVLLKITDYRVKQEEMVSKIRMAMAYPILMAIVGISTVIFMLTFVMPRLMDIFMNMEQALPLPTRLLISLSDGLRQWGGWIILVLALAILIFRRQVKTRAGKLSLSVFKLRMPIMGNFVLKAELARFSRTLALLIKSSIPILKAIDIAIPVLDNEVIKNQLRTSYQELEQGGSFGESLKSSKIFPIFMSNLITVGEESGNLDGALSEIANSYERDTDEAIRIMGNLLEPLMILVMGLIVGFIVVAMLLPIFEINVMAG